MKKIVITIVLFVGVISAQAQEKIKWVTMNEALELQKKNPKKIIMDVYTNWCGPCKMLEKNTFGNKDVAKYINKNYYAVKFNGEGNEEVKYKGYEFKNPNYDPSKANRRNSSHQFAGYMRISAYPTMIFFNEEGDVITPIRGYYSPQQLELYLKLFAKDGHKKITTQEKFNEYAKAFKPSFKG